MVPANNNIEYGLAMIPGEIISNERLQYDYYKVVFYAPEICAKAAPGQFVHVAIAHLRDRILRRPFSISNVTEGVELTVIYKVVGVGTKVLSELRAGEICNLLGPLGKGYSVPVEDETPILVGGGYGAAAMYLLARRSPNPGVVLLGARSAADLLLVDEYRALGFDVRIATNDGSVGKSGFVTALLDEVYAENEGKKLRFYGCGPMPMLLALSRLLLAHGCQDGEVSFDHLMCCGVGACFACVVKVKDGDSWRYARTCNEGPVFLTKDVYFEEEC